MSIHCLQNLNIYKCFCHFPVDTYFLLLLLVFHLRISATFSFHQYSSCSVTSSTDALITFLFIYLFWAFFALNNTVQNDKVSKWSSQHNFQLRQLVLPIGSFSRLESNERLNKISDDWSYYSVSSLSSHLVFLPQTVGKIKSSEPVDRYWEKSGRCTGNRTISKGHVVVLISTLIIKYLIQ